MRDFSFIFAVNAVLTIAAAGGVYIFAKRRLQHSLWLVYNILFGTWSFCLYEAAREGEKNFAAYWINTSLIPLIFMAPVFLHFLSLYSDREVFKKEVVGRIYALFFLIFAVSFFLPKEFVKNIKEGAYFGYVVEPGLIFGIFSVIFTGFIFCGFYYLIRSSRKAYVEFRRNQRLWVFFGMLLGILAPLGFFLASYGIKFFSFGQFCVIPYLALTGYAIVKYYVPEVNIIVKKAGLLAYSTLFTIIIYAFLLYLFRKVIGLEYLMSSAISGSIVLLNILLTVHYGGILKLNKLADNVVYKKRLAYYKFLENFNTMINEVKDLNTLLYYIVGSLMEIIGVESAALYLYNEDDRIFKLIVHKGIDRKSAREIDSVSAENPLVNFLREGNIFVAGENSDFTQDYDLEKVRHAFDKINVKLTIPLRYSMPLYHGRDIIAFLNVGAKKDGASYSQEDIDILNAFGRELSICLDKARLSLDVITDDLTKVYRHSYFHERVEEEIGRSERYKRVFSLFLIDIDDFKRINDVFGHPAGDEVLRKTAGIIKSNIRRVDIPARYGGEEFGVLLPETDKANAIMVAERIRKIVEEKFANKDTKKEILKAGFSDGVRFNVTVSIGVSTYRSGIDKDALIKEADKALYRAKWEGKNKVSGQ